MEFDKQAALNAGYTEQQIDSYLASMPKESTFGEQLKRQTGLGGRYLIEAATALPAMIADAPARLGRGLLGMDIPLASESVQAGLQMAGFPKPETPEERIAQAGVMGLGGLGTGLGLGRALTGATGQTAQRIGQSLGAAPGAQTAGAISAGTTAQAAEEAGAGPVMSSLLGLTAGTVAPMAGYMAGKTGAGTARALKAAIDPITQKGREQAVGGALRRLSLDDRRALAELSKAEEIIPGSKPSVGITSKDYGLAAAERTMQSRNPARFAERVAERNVSRINYLDRYANAPLQKATDKRDAALDLLEAATDKDPMVNARPVIDKIDEILAGPAGKRKAVKAALTDIRESLHTKDGDLEKSLDNLYGARQNIGDKFDPKAMQDPKTSNYRVAKRQVMQIKNALDEQLGKSSPEFMEYLKVYARQSKPINQIEAAKALKEKVMTSAADIQGEYFITPGMWKTHFRSKQKELGQILTKQQMKHLNKITKDIDRGNVLAGIKPLGSDTVQNLSVSHIIGRALTSRDQPTNPLLRTLERPLNFLYKVPDDMAEELLVDAMLDPKLAVELMKKATPTRTDKISQILQRKLEAFTYGASIGTAAQED